MNLDKEEIQRILSARYTHTISCCDSDEMSLQDQIAFDKHYMTDMFVDDLHDNHNIGIIKDQVWIDIEFIMVELNHRYSVAKKEIKKSLPTKIDKIKYTASIKMNKKLF